MISLQPATHRLVSLYFLATDWHYELPETLAIYVSQFSDVAFDIICEFAASGAPAGSSMHFEKEITIH